MGTLVFLGFSGLMLLSALLVVSLRNPVHAMLALIVTLFNAAGVVLTLGAEYVAFIMIIVYGGAVAVLFLFVVMMLDIKKTERDQESFRALPSVGFVIGLLAGEILLASGSGKMLPVPPAASIENIRLIGNALFTEYVYPLQIAGIILLVATIGAILLTHRPASGMRRQKLSDQLGRRPDEVLVLCQPRPGESVWEEGESP